MDTTEDKECGQEDSLSEVFRLASRQAFEDALGSGVPVTIVEDGTIIQLQKVGSKIERREIRKISDGRCCSRPTSTH